MKNGWWVGGWVGGAFLTMIQTDSDSSHHIGTAFIGPWDLLYSSLKVAEVVSSLEGVGKTSAWLKALFQPNRTLLVIDMQVNSMSMTTLEVTMVVVL